MKIILTDDQAAMAVEKAQIEEFVQQACCLIGLDGDELYVNLVSKEAITDLHAVHFDDPTPTDCITFPIDGNRKPGTEASSSEEEAFFIPHVIGEVFVCPEVAQEVCPDHPYRELSLYIVHTLLHLAGLNDLEDEETKEMRATEEKILDALDEKNLVLTSPVAL